MAFIELMMASPMPKTPLVLQPGQYAVEEKYDGIRLEVEVTAPGQIVAWSRYGNVQLLPDHIMQALNYLPAGTYDGELIVPGKRSYGVKELVNGPNRALLFFDALNLLGENITDTSYYIRRTFLNQAMSKVPDIRTTAGFRALSMAPSIEVASMDEVDSFLRMVWARDGEGVILKRLASRYSIGKRPKGDWIKIKKLRRQLMKIVGFEASRGQINYRGKYAMVIVKDSAGYSTTVKTRNDAELAKFEKEAPADTPENFMNPAVHPAVGRYLWIEYQERTPDGSYRHPRWDRWAEPHELEHY